MSKKKAKPTGHAQVRNAFALHATSRKAGYMKHRNEPRGGTKNKQREYLDQERADCGVDGYCYCGGCE